MKNIECNSNGKERISTCGCLKIRVFCTRCHKTIRYEDLPAQQELFIMPTVDKDVVKSEYKMNFGKYRGKLLHEIPVDYLEWAKDNMGGTNVRESIKVFLKFSKEFN